MMCNFSQPRHFYESQHNLESLAAFALGAQHPSVQAILYQGNTIPTTLEQQDRLEVAAKYYWEKAQGNRRLMHSVSRHTKALLGSRNIMFEDISLHITHPELPLIKYYAALLAAKGKMDKDKVWRRHLVYCRPLCLALYEHSRSPHAELCYNASSVMISNTKDKQCFCFTNKASSQCFHVGEWRYSLLPMPWASSQSTNRCD